MSVDVNVCKVLLDKGFAPAEIQAAFEAAQAFCDYLNKRGE